MKRLAIPLMLLALASCTSGQMKESQKQDAAETRLCMAAGMQLVGSAALQDEIVKKSILTPSEMTAALAGKVTLGANKCQAYVASHGKVPKTTFNNYRDRPSELVRMVYACGDLNNGACPYTRIDISNNKITSISASEDY